MRTNISVSLLDNCAKSLGRTAINTTSRLSLGLAIVSLQGSNAPPQTLLTILSKHSSVPHQVSDHRSSNGKTNDGPPIMSDERIRSIAEEIDAEDSSSGDVTPSPATPQT